VEPPLRLLLLGTLLRMLCEEGGGGMGGERVQSACRNHHYNHHYDSYYHYHYKWYSPES